MSNSSSFEIGGNVGPGAAVGPNAKVQAVNIAGRDIYFNVPRPIPPSMPELFVGRKLELEQLARLLTTNKSNDTITIINGARGIGKTALVTVAINQLLFRFPDCLWVDMSEYRGQPLAAVRRLIRQLGHSVDGLETLDAATEFLRGLLTNLRAILVLDNVDSSEEIKYFVRLKEQPQSVIAIITNNERIKNELGVKSLDLGPFDERNSINLLRQITGFKSPRYRDSFKKIAYLLHGIPGLICPIAIQIKAEGPEGTEKWIQRLEQETLVSDEFSASDASLMFHAIYRDLSPIHRTILRLAAVLYPAKCRIITISKITHQDTGKVKLILNELASLRIFDKTEEDVYRPDFLLRVSIPLLLQQGPELDELLTATHNYYIGWLERLNQKDNPSVAEHELQDVRILFSKAIEQKKWDIVRRYSMGCSTNPPSKFRIEAWDAGTVYMFESTPFSEFILKAVRGNICKIDMRGGSGEDIQIISGFANLVNLDGTTFRDIIVSDSVATGFSLKGATFRDLLVNDSKITTFQMEGATFRDIILNDSTASDIDLRDSDFRDINLMNSKLLEVRFLGAKSGKLNMKDSVLTTPDPITIDSHSESTTLSQGS